MRKFQFPQLRSINENQIIIFKKQLWHWNIHHKCWTSDSALLSPPTDELHTYTHTHAETPVRGRDGSANPAGPTTNQLHLYEVYKHHCLFSHIRYPIQPEICVQNISDQSISPQSTPFLVLAKIRINCVIRIKIHVLQNLDV